MNKEQLISSAQLAEYLGTTTANLAQWRYKGTGPKFIKIGYRAVRYRWADIETWIEANTISQSDQDYAPKPA